MTREANDAYKPKPVAPHRVDPPGTITEMPKPREMHHVHIFTDENYDAMVAFYQTLFNGSVTNEHIHRNGHRLTFITYDDHDKMVKLFESGVPDSVLLDREKIRKMASDGRL